MSVFERMLLSFFSWKKKHLESYSNNILSAVIIVVVVWTVLFIYI